jgi:hypothetical protein
VLTSTDSCLAGDTVSVSSNVIRFTVKSPATASIYDTLTGGGSVTVAGHTYTRSGTYTNTISGGAANGCDSIVTLYLLVRGCSPEVSISYTGTGTCSTQTFTANTLNTAGTVNYVWHVNTSPVGWSQSYTATSLNYNDSVWVYISSASVCGGTAIMSATSEKIRINGAMATVPSVTISANHTNLDLPGAVTLSAISAGAGQAPIYSWYVNGNHIVDGRGYANVVYGGYLGNGDQITCTLTALTCSSTPQYVNSNTLTFTKSGSNAKDITAFTMPGQIGSSVINTTAATVTGTVPAGSRTAMHPTAVSISPLAAMGPSYLVNRDFTGSVTYTIHAQNGSSKVWTITYTDPSGHRTMAPSSIAATASAPDAISVYPDPASQYVVLSAAGGSEAPVVTIVDMMGRIMYNQKLPVTDRVNHMVDVSEYSKGEYIVYLAVGDKKQTKNFVVAK